MKINPFVYGMLVLAVFMGMIVGAQAFGFWSTSGKLDASGQALQPSTADVNTIKGWMTLGQVSATYNVPLEEILSTFDLPAETPASTALKDLEGGGFDIPGLRDWLSKRDPVP